MPFTVKINTSDDRVNTGAIEDAIRGTFAEVLSEQVEVYVNQFDDHTLCITVEREEGAALPDPDAELERRLRAAVVERADFVKRAEEHEEALELARRENHATETRAELEARIREECANEEAFRRNLDGYCFDE